MQTAEEEWNPGRHRWRDRCRNFEVATLGSRMLYFALVCVCVRARASAFCFAPLSAWKPKSGAN